MDFRLIETMRVSEAGTVDLLDRHLLRLSLSARHFSFCCDPAKLRDRILEAGPREAGPYCLRLALARDGESSLESRPFPQGHAQTLKLARSRVNSNDVFLYHKTTNRRIYEEAHRGCGEQTDVILINEGGEITETTILNIAVFRDGHWVTPPVSCGLLPGVMREELLSKGQIVEGIILANQLEPGELLRCFNALRGVFEIPLTERE